MFEITALRFWRCFMQATHQQPPPSWVMPRCCRISSDLEYSYSVSNWRVKGIAKTKLGQLVLGRYTEVKGGMALRLGWTLLCAQMSGNTHTAASTVSNSSLVDYFMFVFLLCVRGSLL